MSSAWKKMGSDKALAHAARLKSHGRLKRWFSELQEVSQHTGHL